MAGRNDDDTPGAAPLLRKPRVWSAEEILGDSSCLVAPGVPPGDARLADLLFHDMVSEYDARHLDAHLRGLPIEFTPDFQAMERVWAQDERNHFEGFALVNRMLFGLDDERLEREVFAREADFTHLAPLFEDEFSILVLLAYDELVTVQGLSRDIEVYDPLGEEMRKFIRMVIADEAWHYEVCRDLILRVHAGRLGELEEKVARVRAAQGQPYRSTFVYDHDVDVYGAEIFDRAAGRLRVSLGRP